MRAARHVKSSIPLMALAALAAATGCGSSDSGGPGYGPRDATTEPPTATATTPAAPPGATARSCAGRVAGASQLRVTGIGCDVGRRVVAAWVRQPSCSVGNEASRTSCSVDEYRCLGASVEGGVAVSCAAPGRSVAFLADRR